MIQPCLTMDQYQKLLDMLGQSSSTDSIKEVGAEPPNNTSLPGKICLNAHFSPSWVLDSGTTYHICHNLSLFSSYHLIDNLDNTITVPDGRNIQITLVGTIPLNELMTLQQVLYVHGFHFNLVSVPKLCYIRISLVLLCFLLTSVLYMPLH